MTEWFKLQKWGCDNTARKIMRIRARYRGFSLKYLKIDWPQKKKKRRIEDTEKHVKHTTHGRCHGTMRLRPYHILLCSVKEKEGAVLSRGLSKHLFIVFSPSIPPIKEDVNSSWVTGFLHPPECVFLQHLIRTYCRYSSRSSQVKTRRIFGNARKRLMILRRGNKRKRKNRGREGE